MSVVSTMAKLESTLSESLEDFVAEHVGAGKYADADSYLQDVLTREQAASVRPPSCGVCSTPRTRAASVVGRSRRS